MPVDLKPAPRGRRQSFSVAMRMARRDIRRHRGRSLLIVLLIMLPVAGMTGAVTLVQSSMETPAERVEHQLGQAQARYQKFMSGNETFVQDPLNETITASNNGQWDPDFVGADPGDVLPAGFSVLTESAFDVSVEHGQSDVPVMGSEVDALNPAFTGKFSLLRGRAPSAAGEALVSPGLLDRFGLVLGGKLTTSEGTFTAVGTVRDAGLSDRNSVLYLLPGQVDRETVEEAALQPVSPRGGVLYYLTGPRPITWDQIREANAVGVAVLSRHVALNPPPMNQRSVDGSPPKYEPYVPFSTYLTAGYIGALALLEVGLLAGAAFAVGAKRQVRELALLAASGAEAPTVKAVVTAAGLWLGGLAVACGAALGLAGAAGVVFVARAIGSARLPGFHTDSLLTAGAMAMGLLACMLSAYAPARQVSRQAALGALKSGRAPSHFPKRGAITGAIILVVSAGLMLAGALYAMSTDHPDVLAGRATVISAFLISGGVLAVVALLLLTGPAIFLMARRSGGFPLAVRMACRDASRNLGRTVPAVAAVLAAVTLASAGMIAAASMQASMMQSYGSYVLENQAELSLPINDAVLPGPVDGDRNAELITSALARVTDSIAWTEALTHPVPPGECLYDPVKEEKQESEETAATDTISASCLSYSLAVPEGNECIFTEGNRVRYPGDWRCRGSMMPHPSRGPTALLVGGATDIRATFGVDASEEAIGMLEAGGIVVTNPVFVRDGSVVLQTDEMRRNVEPSEGIDDVRISARQLPAVLLEPRANISLFGVVSPATAERLGIQLVTSKLRVQFKDYPSDEDKEAISNELVSLYGHPNGFFVQGKNAEGSPLTWAIVGLAALITLSAAGVTTGLSLADARTDHMTLAGVGASPGLRKALAGSQALLTVGVGTILGCVAGVVPMLLILYSSEMKPYAAVPWLQLAALLVVVPLTAAALAWLFTRARLPMSRRAVGT